MTYHTHCQKKVYNWMHHQFCCSNKEERTGSRGSGLEVEEKTFSLEGRVGFMLSVLLC